MDLFSPLIVQSLNIGMSGNADGPVLDDTLSFKPIVEFSSRTKLILSYVFLVCIIVESSALYFQAYEIFKNRSAKDVSTLAFAILLATNCYWLFYALTIVGSMAIAASGILYIIGAILVLAGKWIYGDGKDVEHEA